MGHSCCRDQHFRTLGAILVGFMLFAITLVLCIISCAIHSEMKKKEEIQKCKCVIHDREMK